MEQVYSRFSELIALHSFLNEEDINFRCFFFLTGKKDPTQIIGAAQELSEKTRVSFNMMLSPHRKYVPAYLLFFCTSEISSDFYFSFPFYVCGFWEVQDIFCIIPSFSLCFVICFPLYGCGGAWQSVTLLILGLSKFLQHLKLTTSTTQRLQQNTKKKSFERTQKQK